MNWSGFITTLVRTVVGAAAGTANSLFTLLKQGFKLTMQFHEQSIATARQIGMTQSQAHSYAQVLVKDAKELGVKYGITADAVKKITENLSNAIGRNVFLNQQQREAIVQMNKLVGEQTTGDFMTQMVSGMGAQVDSVHGAVAKTYATAMRQGLNVQKMSAKVAQNLQLANKLSFRDGVNGIIKMAALSEKVGANLQSLAGAANNFLELDKAIENAARMQMLGGSAAMYGGNPLTMTYEANYDPEAFMERMTKTLGGYATFDQKTGMGRVNGLSMDFVRQIAQTLGMSTEEAVTIAKRQAEAKYKENAFGTQINEIAKGNESLKNFLLNSTQVSGNTLMLNGQDINNITAKDLEKMAELQNMDEKQLLEKQAIELTDINSRISGFITSIEGKIAEWFAPLIPKLNNWLNSKLPTVVEGISEWLDKNDPVEAINNGLAWIKGQWSWFKYTLGGIGVALGVGGAAKIGSSIMSALRGANGCSGCQQKMLDEFKNFNGNARRHQPHSTMWKGNTGATSSTVPNTNGTTSTGRMARFKNSVRGLGTKVKNFAIGNSNGAGSQWSRFSGEFKSARAGGSGIFKSLSKGFGGSTISKMSAGTKALGAIGTAISVGQGLYAVGDYVSKKAEIQANGSLSQEEKDKLIDNARIEKNSAVGSAIGGAIGASIGTFIGGPVGTAVGAWLGGTVGEMVGKHWDDITNTVKKTWDGIKSVAGDVASAAKSAISTTYDWVSGGVSAAAKGIGSFLGGTAKLIMNAGSSIREGFKGIINNSTVVAKPVGGKEYIYTPTSSRSGMVNGNEVTVKDFNVNINGTIRLDGGNSSRNIDINELLRDQSFVSSLKDIIKESINNDMNGGRFNQDVVTRRGGIANKTIWG